MKPFEHRYAPGQIHAAWFRRGSAIAALEGTLQISYRDASLDWLLGDAPKVSVVLHEGERHVLPYEAFVEVIAIGQHAVIAQIDSGPLNGSMVAKIGRLLVSLGRLNGASFRRG
ncbi:hypothetical protein [Burkholderia sp. Ac-20365]|uniref:hypothetical protein n=1 Tax=Burkholderia sp. Ac-20365 TaxID=2703897 RepID=UPI00197B6479|nr:hypothetical protein [Burkholderia sp. Ac-20365]MBN3764960.1 hypothetical protein [Burkholderia sp. Ac-20365]